MRQELLPPMTPGDAVLCKLSKWLNQLRLRKTDMAKIVDRDDDGIVSPQQLREGLSRLGIEPSEKDFEAALATLRKDSDGNVPLKDFHLSLRLAVRKAKREADPPPFRDTHGSTGEWRLSAMSRWNPSVTGSSISSSQWLRASEGSMSAALTDLLYEASQTTAHPSLVRKRYLEVSSVPGARAPELLMLSGSSMAYQDSITREARETRWGPEPVTIPRELLQKRDRCATAGRRFLQQSLDAGGIKKFPMSVPNSMVEEIMSGVALSPTGKERLGKEFISIFEGRAGLPTWESPQEAVF